MNLNIRYDDAELIIVDKPSGLLAVPGRGPAKQDCVVNRVKDCFSGIIEQPAVHRLDMYTSGLMLLAKTRNAHRHLSRQFESQKVEKRYVALVQGMVMVVAGEIRLSFRLDPDNRPYQIYDPIHGREGITRWKRLEVQDGVTRIEFKPLTGRTHQLRLHAAHPLGLGAPIIGDRLYGSDKEAETMCLHACDLAFRHPKDDQPFSIASHVPF